LRASCCYPPHHVPNIIGDEQRAGTIDGNPTGRSNAAPSLLRKPVKTSNGDPEGCPPANGTKITLYPLLEIRFQDPCSPMNAPLRYCSGRSVPVENVSPRAVKRIDRNNRLGYKLRFLGYHLVVNVLPPRDGPTALPARAAKRVSWTSREGRLRRCALCGHGGTEPHPDRFE
jgi:hypothetical protein